MKLTGKDWANACDMWRSGHYTLDAISKKYGVNPVSLSKRFKRNDVIKGADADIERKAINQVIKERVGDNDELGKVITEVRQLNLKGSVMLTKLVLSEVKQAREAGRPLSVIEPNIKSIERAAKVLNTNYNTAEKILHLDKDDDGEEDLPDLIVERMTQEDVEDLRRAQQEEIEELTGGSEDIDLDDIEDLDD